MRRVLGIIFVCCFLLQGMALSASNIEVNPDTNALTSYKDATGAITLPTELDGTLISRVGHDVFYSNSAITKVSLPEGYRYIDQNAFYFCTALSELSLPEGLVKIGPFAFFGCEKIKDLTIPATVQVIEENAFAGLYGLEALTFKGPAPLFLKEGAFNLESLSPKPVVTVPANYKEAYEELLSVPCTAGPDAAAFANSFFPEDLDFDTQTGVLKAYTGAAVVLELPAKIDGVPLTGIGDGAFQQKADLTLLTLPEGVSAIGKNALRNAVGLRHIDLPTTLLSLGENCFTGTTSLESVTLPEGVTTLPKEAFLFGGLVNVHLPASLKEIGDSAFRGCSRLIYIVLAGDELPVLGKQALEGAPIEDVDIAPEATLAQVEKVKQGLATVGIDTNVWRAELADAAPWPQNAEFTIDPDTGIATAREGIDEKLTMFWTILAQDKSPVRVTGLGEGLFENAEIKHFDVPRNNDFTSIGARAFKNSQLERIRFVDGVTEIGAEAFAGTQLEQVILPASIKTLGARAFADASKLKELIFLGGAPEIGADAFANTALERIVLPAGSTLLGHIGVQGEKVRVADGATAEQLARLEAALDLPWYMSLQCESATASLPFMPKQLVPSAESDFEFDADTGTIIRYVGQQPAVVIPRTIGGVTVKALLGASFSNIMDIVADNAASGHNTTLKSVVIPETVTEIGDNAFNSCKALETATIYGPIERLGIRAFEGNDALTEVRFLTGVRRIDKFAFQGDSALKNLDLGTKVWEIEEGAFTGCSSLTGAVTLDIEKLGEAAFEGCLGITQLRLSDRIKSLADRAFAGMNKLETLVLPSAERSLFVAEAYFPFPAENDKLTIYVPETTNDATFEALAGYINEAYLRKVDILKRGAAPVTPESWLPDALQRP